MIGFYKAVIEVLNLSTYRLPDGGRPPVAVPGFPGFTVHILPKGTVEGRRPHRVKVNCRCGRTLGLSNLHSHRRVCHD